MALQERQDVDNEEESFSWNMNVSPRSSRAKDWSLV